MQRVQAFNLLICCACVCLVSCTREVAPVAPSVSEFLHDIDAARSILVAAKNDPARYQNDPGVINARAALERYVVSDKIKLCFPKSGAASATTDHACLDSLGYKR